MSGSGTDDCHTLRYALELDDETWTPVQKLRRVMDDAHHMLVQGRKGLFFNLPHDALLAMVRHPLLAQLDCIDPRQRHRATHQRHALHSMRQCVHKAGCAQCDLLRLHTYISNIRRNVTRFTRWCRTRAPWCQT